MPSSPLTLPFAIKAAEAHAEVGLAEFNALQHELAGAKQRNTQPNYFRLIRHAVPAVTNLALASELLLKVLVFQHTGAYPHGHGLPQLLQLLPAECVGRMRHDYSSLHATPRDLQVGQISFQISSTQVNGPETPMVTNLSSFEEAIAALDGCYQEWRYVYENIHDDSVSVDFRGLLFVIEALHKEVIDLRGTAKATMSSDKTIRMEPRA